MTILRLDLASLYREGAVELSTRLPVATTLWDGTCIEWEGPVEVELSASIAGSGEIVVSGLIEGRLKQDCRRCLQSVVSAIEHELMMVFVSNDTEEVEDDDGIYLFDQGIEELDLRAAIREEVVFEVDPYVICSPDCEGLCPRCGINWNKDVCNCGEDHTDPRWEALRVLKEK